MNANDQASTKSSPPVGKLLFAWIWVGVPLLWGISQTFIKALGLFK